jgi:hypothetical protein
MLALRCVAELQSHQRAHRGVGTSYARMAWLPRPGKPVELDEATSRATSSHGSQSASHRAPPSTSRPKRAGSRSRSSCSPATVDTTAAALPRGGTPSADWDEPSGNADSRHDLPRRIYTVKLNIVALCANKRRVCLAVVLPPQGGELLTCELELALVARRRGCRPAFRTTADPHRRLQTVDRSDPRWITDQISSHFHLPKG